MDHFLKSRICPKLAEIWSKESEDIWCHVSVPLKMNRNILKHLYVPQCVPLPPLIVSFPVSWSSESITKDEVVPVGSSEDGFCAGRRSIAEGVTAHCWWRSSHSGTIFFFTNSSCQQERCSRYAAQTGCHWAVISKRVCVFSQGTRLILCHSCRLWNVKSAFVWNSIWFLVWFYLFFLRGLVEISFLIDRRWHCIGNISEE